MDDFECREMLAQEIEQIKRDFEQKVQECERHEKSMQIAERNCEWWGLFSYENGVKIRIAKTAEKRKRRKWRYAVFGKHG